MIICRHMPAPHWFFPRLSYKTADENKLITTDERDSFEDSFFKFWFYQQAVIFY